MQIPFTRVFSHWTEVFLQLTLILAKQKLILKFNPSDHSEQLQRDQHSMDPESHEFSDLHNSSFSLDVVAAGQMPYVVIYVIDPFTSGSPGEENRLAFLGILRMFHNMVKLMPEHFRSSIQLQVRLK